MSSSVLYMSMSLDGFITGPDDEVGQGLGSGGRRRPRRDPPALPGEGMTGGTHADESRADAGVV